MLLALTPASRTSDTEDEWSSLDGTQRSGCDNKAQGATMEAAVGDRIVVAAATLGGPMRDGEIIEVGSHGGPPYLVRWSTDGRETLFYPGRTPMSVIRVA